MNEQNRPPNNRGQFSLKVRRVADPNPDRKIQRKSAGKRTRLGICEFVAALLETNETLPKHRKLTDATLTREIVREFPDRKPVLKMLRGILGMGYWRALYNSGKLTNGRVPATRANRWTEDGLVAHPKSGRPLNPQPILPPPAPGVFLERNTHGVVSHETHDGCNAEGRLDAPGS